MEGLLQGISSTGVLLDNILITGPNNEEHLANIKKALRHLSEAGLRLKAVKCHFMKPGGTELMQRGFILSKQK